MHESKQLERTLNELGGSSELTTKDISSLKWVNGDLAKIKKELSLMSRSPEKMSKTDVYTILKQLESATERLEDLTDSWENDD